MPAPALERSSCVPAPAPEELEKTEAPRAVTPEPDAGKRDPPSALVEPIPRKEEPKESSPPPEPKPEPRPEVNGHAERSRSPVKPWKSEESTECKENGKSWRRGGSPLARRRPPAPAATSVVFNFSARQDVPDYIENDGIILRNKRDKIKSTDPGVVVLRAEALRDSESESEAEADGRPPSPCAVRFVNDNVLINGRSSMPHKPGRARAARLKIQFDDSLTRTFEYPSETSLAEEPAPPPQPPHDAPHALGSNTHIASAALARYTPSKTRADAFQLGVTRLDAPPTPENGSGAASEASADEGDARPCAADAARSWSEARTHATDLLF